MVAAGILAYVCTTVGATASIEAVPSGKWVGRSDFVGPPSPKERRSSLTVNVTAQTLSVVAIGPTGASHDPASATGTCTSRYRFAKEIAGWRYYEQTSGTVKGEGGIETAPCSTRPEVVARLRPAGAKLKIEFGMVLRGEYRSYLHRAYLTRP